MVPSLGPRSAMQPVFARLAPAPPAQQYTGNGDDDPTLLDEVAA